MITEIGKELRKIRIEHDERLLDMSAKLEKSSAFISAVERGTKSPPSGFEDLVINTYRLAGQAAQAVRQAANRSRKAFTIEPESALARDMAGAMARRMNSLSDEELKSILAILRKGEGT